MKFVKAKEPIEVALTVEKPMIERKKNVADQWMLTKPRNQSMGKSESRAKSRPQSQRGPRSNYVCHHCGLQGHTRPNYQKLKAMNNVSGLGYIGGSSLSGSVAKEVKFIKAKKQIEVSPTAEKPKMEEKKIGRAHV